MFYCVSSIYRAGGNVTRDIRAVHSPVKPDDTEEELDLFTVVNKYFNTEEDAVEYLNSLLRQSL